MSFSIWTETRVSFRNVIDDPAYKEARRDLALRMRERMADSDDPMLPSLERQLQSYTTE